MAQSDIANRKQHANEQCQTDPRFDVVTAQSAMKRDATHDVRAEKLASVFDDIACSFAKRVGAGERL